MVTYQKVLREVLTKITPEDENPPEIGKTLDLINKALKKKNIPAYAILGGSFAKGVWIAHESDVDIFVRFDQSYRGKDMSAVLLQALHQFSLERIHGSRDYFCIKNSFTYEVIPVLHIKSPGEAENVIDNSPMHTEWVNRLGKELRDDIRLAKQFAKGAKAYGAESYRQGLSGHVVDILVIAAGGFLKLVREMARWKPKTIVDVGKAYKRSPLIYLNASKTLGPLVVIDPIDPQRNAAAAVNQESYDRLKKHAQAFLKHPSVSFFEEKKPPKEPGRNAVIIGATPLNDKEDISGAKLRKAFFWYKRKLEDSVGVVHADWWWDAVHDGIFLFKIKTVALPREIEICGPPVRMEEFATAFKKKHPRAKVVQGRLRAREQNPFASLYDLLLDAGSEPKKQKWVTDSRILVGKAK